MSDKIYYVKYNIFMPYEFKKRKGFYVLFEDSLELVSFKRPDFREAMDSVGRGSNWTGCMLKIFNKRFPLKSKPRSKESASDYDYLTLVNYMRSKGYLVYDPVPLSDLEIIIYLNSRGTIVERQDESSKNLVPSPSLVSKN